MRVGVFFNIISIALVCVFNKDLQNLYMVFAACCGLAGGIYWIGYNSFMANTMGGTKMLRFQAYSNIASSAAKIVLPFSLGAIIKYVGFFAAAAVAFGIGLILITFTLIMQVDTAGKGKLSYIAYFKLLKEKKLIKPVALNFAMQFFHDLRGRASFCVVILLAVLYKGKDASFSIGWLSSVFSAMAIIMLTCYRLVKSRKVKNNVFLICASSAFLLSLGILFKMSLPTIIMFQFAQAVLLIVPQIETGKMQCDVMKELNQPHVTTESLVVVEFAYYLARIFIMSVVILAWHFNVFVVFKILACTLTFAAVVSYILFRTWWHYYKDMVPRVPYTVKQRKHKKPAEIAPTPVTQI